MNGCEFIDDGCYGTVPPSGTRVWWLTPELIQRYADPEQWARVHMEDVTWLYDDIAQHGFLTPLELRIDTAGEARLQEGHHRLRVAFMLNTRKIPLKLRWMRQPMDRGWHRTFVPKLLVEFTEDWLDVLAQKT